MISRMVVLVVGAALFCTSPGFAVAGPNETYTVYVEHSGNDAVGKSLVFSVKEELRRSARFSLVRDPKKADLGLYLATMDPRLDDESSGLAVAVARVLVMKPATRQHMVHYSVNKGGRDNVDAYARETILLLDHRMDVLAALATDKTE